MDQATVDAFWDARQRGEFFPTAFFDKLSIEQAYDVQLALIDRRVAAGEKHIGWKVGLTSVAIQQQFAVHEPVFGCILNTVPSGHVFAPADTIQPGFENGIQRVEWPGTGGEEAIGVVMRAADGLAFDEGRELVRAQAQRVGVVAHLLRGLAIHHGPFMQAETTETRWAVSDGGAQIGDKPREIAHAGIQQIMPEGQDAVFDMGPAAWQPGMCRQRGFAHLQPFAKRR